MMVQSSMQPYTNPTDMAAISIWKSKVFPNLDNCLNRRKQLIAQSSTPEEGIMALAQELGDTYNLSLYNIAGIKQLYTTTNFLDGYLDISGQLSGEIKYKITGRDPSSSVLGNSGFLSSIFSSREIVWWCSVQYVDPNTNTSNNAQCFERFSSTLSSFFVGKYLTVDAGSRYQDNGAFIKGIKTDNITSYFYKLKTLVELKTIEYAQLRNFSSFRHFHSEVISAISGEPFVSTNAVEEICLVGDGCFESCLNASASSGTTLTFMRGGVCHSVVDTLFTSTKELYLDIKCYGIGNGTSNIMITYITASGARYQAIANNTASPLSIYSCTIGGRLTFEEYPTFFMDMLSQGTQASLIISSSNGSEAIILNFIALVSLLGYIYFFFCISQFLVMSYFYVNTHPQLTYSLTKCNVSSVVWNEHRSVMVATGFLGLVAWHIGACQLNCKWNDAAILNIELDPVYTCTVNPFGHFQNFGEIIRLISQAWVFFAIVHLDRMPGIGSDGKGYAIAVFYLGFIPLSISAMIVALGSTIRTEIAILAPIHSQLFLATLWAAIILVMRISPFSPYIKLVEWFLGMANIIKQPISRKSSFYSIVGEYYWTHSSHSQDSKAEYVPLSLLLQTKGFSFRSVSNHEFFIHQDGKSCFHGSTIHPEWIEIQLEYYVKASN
ncbi:hypothetical protein THRCLA_20165 [Thraustotheca clavata]|uniref:Transmembrane protein n=1 Tax=Thraustotheca clavata TaxID=74557 RepID=A0A1W0AAR5_9STRA|nr:hypothetical protein THRCLA_20165 [Thraustotheca clavata]